MKRKMPKPVPAVVAVEHDLKRYQLARNAFLEAKKTLRASRSQVPAQLKRLRAISSASFVKEIARLEILAEKIEAALYPQKKN